MGKKNKSINAKKREAIKQGYNKKAAHGSQPATERAIIIAALDFAMATCTLTAEAEMGITQKTLRNILKGYPFSPAQAGYILDGARNMGWKQEVKPA